MSMNRLDLKVGFSCNLRCKFCIQGEKRFQYKPKTLKELTKLMKQNYETGIKEIVLTGGEPTIHKDIIDIIKCAKKMGYKLIQIQSNGRMFCNINFCKSLISAGATEFALSLHGSSAKIHDNITQTKGAFKQTINGIKNLKDLDQHVMVNVVITKNNYKDLPNISKLFIYLGVNFFQFAFVHINWQNRYLSTKKDSKLIVPKKSEIMPYVKKALDMGIKSGKRVVTEAIPYCFMQGYENCVGEKTIPQTIVEDATRTIEDFGKYRKNHAKIKTLKCDNCFYFNICEGPWKEYPELYGWGEFKPVISRE